MIDKLNSFFIGRVYAQFDSGGGALADNWFNMFKPFGKTPNSGSAKATFGEVISFAMSWVLAVVAVLAFVYLIMSGVNYITAGGDSEKATKARTGILNAIIGIVVVVLAFFILRFAATLGGNLGDAA
ncbi:MAG: hypothetical protein AAB669_00455 [Patescibacteria group bacterium]